MKQWSPPGEFFSFICCVFVIEFSHRENMKLIKHFFVGMLCLVPFVASGQVATTAGSNLTAWNGNSGATNNNNWNTMMNSRTSAAAVNKPKADFGNCNSLILRCAQPKCAGCTTMDVARPIVEGCVNSNATCKKHGADLVEFISAQMVSDANEKIQQQELMAQQAAAQQAAAQSNAQIQQMQQQMQQMQYQMEQQSAQQMKQMQAALEAQQAMAAQAISDVSAAQATASAVAADAGAQGSETVPSQAQIDAMSRGVDEEILARQKISDQILEKIDRAEVELNNLYKQMQDVFAYAGCDSRGNNCSGPKRVKAFKNKARMFFEPYDGVIEEAYEALELALAVGVDVSDVIMMLNGACNKWGKFMCRVGSYGSKGEKYLTYNPQTCKNGRSIKGGYIKGGQECADGMVVPPQDDARCTLTGFLDSSKDVQREWVLENEEGDGLVRLGCATDALDSISIFGRRRSRAGSALDLDTLERMLLQDAPDVVGMGRYSDAQSSGDAEYEATKYCSLTPRGYSRLQTAINTKTLPAKDVCVPYNSLLFTRQTDGALQYSGSNGATSNIIPGIQSEVICNNIRAANNVSGCKVEWQCYNKDGESVACTGADVDSRRCVVDGVGCSYDYENGVIRQTSDKKETSNSTINNATSVSNSGGNAVSFTTLKIPDFTLENKHLVIENNNGSNSRFQLDYK